MNDVQSGKAPEHYDILLAGNSISVIMLAACLARNKVRVGLLRNRQMPPDLTGEATIPYTSMIFELIADRYGVPEIKNIARTRDIQQKVMPSSGVKKNLGFIYHQRSRAVDLGQALQFNVPSEHGENHLFRPDIDAYLLAAAIGYGAQLVEIDNSPEVLVEDSGVKVATALGRWVTADFMVDGSQGGQVLARQAGLVSQASTQKTRTLEFSTHMLGVVPFDECVQGDFPGQWHGGTLHHVFDGGWVGVIPFNNHQHSRNPLVSVLVSLREDLCPSMDGDQVLAGLIELYPGLGRHLSGARRVREWALRQPPRQVYRTALERRCLMFDEGAASNDLLFSRKLSNAAELVLALAHRLIKAAHSGDYRSPALNDFVLTQDSIISLSDRIASAAYVSFRDPELWNAFARVWLLQSIAATITARKINDAFAKDLDPRVFDEIDQLAEDGFWMPLYQGYKDILNTTLGLCDDVKSAKVSAAHAASSIFAELANASFVPPIFDFANPHARVYQLTTLRKLKALWWGLMQVPSEVGRLIFYRSFRKPSLRKES
ncbi:MULTISPECIES: NAD(P)/FAD-dependent oxidoreductase [Pseudomonas]|jgi:hypothetical protein|uniref:PltD n=2 Tax=Pseudomonas TaxID=286 RepID=A0A2C9EM37_PSEPH|nr:MULTISPECIES: hypothetical protein [Pseudomonas]AGL84618.1 PltD [Pseudomonas protegens CHA0]MBP5094542.1 halogenase [Pseudomonas protegens]MBP5112247.1 halogenase [Pseudomonas protegens]MBP5118335.1 halogenase [Pseudomonas protegens]MCS4259427.1 hypothetical protein [Pseudomonas sp. BIGb0176]